MLSSKKLQAKQELERKILHDLRNEGMKAFGQYFMFYVVQSGVSPDEANSLALREAAVLFEEISLEFRSKASYGEKK